MGEDLHFLPANDEDDSTLLPMEDDGESTIAVSESVLETTISGPPPVPEPVPREDESESAKLFDDDEMGSGILFEGVTTGEVELPTPEEVRARADKFLADIRAQRYPERHQQTYTSKMPVWQNATDLYVAAKTPINWGADQLYTQRARILLAAEPKVGKTFIVCTLLLAVASGQNLWDKIRIMDPGPVCVVAGEDDNAEIGRRIHRMCKASGILMTTLPIHFLPGHSIRLNRVRDQEFLRESVRKLGAKLVIYDPLSRLMEGDENSKEMVSQVLNPASELAADEGVSVCIVHHLGKQSQEKPRSAMERVRGSSDISSWFSCGLFASGNMRNGRVNMEFFSRVSSKLPAEFFLDVKETEPIEGEELGAMKLVARISLDDDEMRKGPNEQLITQTREKLLDLVVSRGAGGLTISEALIHIGCGRILLNASLKQLIRDEGLVRFEDDTSIPDGKVIIPTLDRPAAAPKGGFAEMSQPEQPDQPGEYVPTPAMTPEEQLKIMQRIKGESDKILARDDEFDGRETLPGF